MKFNSILFKIRTLYIILLAFVLIIYSGLIYLSLHYTLYHALDEELTQKAREINKAIIQYVDVLGNDMDSLVFAGSRVIRLEGRHPLENKIWLTENNWLRKSNQLNLDNDFISVRLPNKEIINNLNMVEEKNLSRVIENIQASAKKTPSFKNINLANISLRVICYQFSHPSLGSCLITIGTSSSPLSKLLRKRFFHLLNFIPLVLILAGLFGSHFAARILKSIEEVIKISRQITYKDLSVRVKADHIDIEMRYLVDAFNEMISRLEKSFNYIEQFSSELAHELKTPLAIIKGESEVVLRKEQNIDEYKRVIKTILEEVARMLKSINDMLVLMRLDYNPEVFNIEEINFNDFIKAIFEKSKILAANKNIDLKINMPGEMIKLRGDAQHLRCLFFNLIHNAIKFTAPNGLIKIIIECNNKQVEISITDKGPGIAEEDLAKIFSNFFHKDISNQGNDPGNGLGLSIALSVAKKHFGDIKVKSKLKKGSTFTVSLPLT
ncbi:MAG: HAMP domain-containing histidine kinase [Candidatus Omnitrophica bacterium]|nr:HAMP domain-containing histidine kinase [Candidatus Omnitrophota bacterium]